MSSKNVWLQIALVGALSFLAGCAEKKPPNDGLDEIRKNDAAAPQTDDKLQPLEAPPSTHDTEFATFSVEPGHVSACSGKDRAVSVVAWKVKDPNVAAIKVLLSSAEDDGKKLFTAGGAEGKAETGNWVGAGVKFHLIDAKTEKELATHVVTMLPCLE